MFGAGAAPRASARESTPTQRDSAVRFSVRLIAAAAHTTIAMEHPRFRAAILSARSLHPDLLTQGQKLKLYALFRQSQGPAPPEPPADPTTLAQAKWEAWRDVRGLSQQEAMDAYSEIIEGLTGLMAALGPDGGGPPPPPDKRHVPEAQPPPPPQYEEEYEVSDEEDDEDDESEEEDDEYDEDEDDAPPEVSQTVWQTEGVSVAAGDTFEVPLAFDAPCKCTYSLSVLPGSTGPIGLKLYATEGFSSPLDRATPIAVHYESTLNETSIEVGPPGGSGGPAALRVELDNTASTFSTIDVKVRVLLEPLGELLALDHYRSRQALRGLIQRKEEALEAHTRKHALIGEAAEGLAARLDSLRLEVAKCEGELRLKHREIENGAEMADLMAHEVNALRQQLRDAP